MKGTNETRPMSTGPSNDIDLHRRMRKQALKTPWSEVAAACERMIEWRSFTLWVRAVADVERSLPVWLQGALEERCPGFLRARRSESDIASLWLDLPEWIDTNFFNTATDGNWIEALHYYSGRTAVAENVWQHWSRIDAEWQKRRPIHYPTFDEWHQRATAASEKGVPDTPPAPLIARYVEWDAFASWVRSVVECAHEIPTFVLSDLEQRCPGFLMHVRELRAKPCFDAQWLWRELLQWVENHAFAEAKEISWIESIRAAAHASLRSERVAEYWTTCSLKWGRTPPATFPAFREWLAEADAFIEK